MGRGLTCAAVGTLAIEGGHPVVAGGPVEAGSHGAVVDVLAAVLSRPAINADTVVAAMVVVAGAPVLAGVGHQLALVHVLGAVLTCQGQGTYEAGAAQLPQAPRASLGSPTALPSRSLASPGAGPVLPAQPRATLTAAAGVTCPLGWALAVVGVDAIHAGASVLAVVARTVIDVLLTVLAREPCAEEMSAVMLTHRPAGRATTASAPCQPPPTAGCSSSGAAPSPALKPATWFHPSPISTLSGLGSATQASLPGHHHRSLASGSSFPRAGQNGASPARGSPAKAPGSADACPEQRRIQLHGKTG